MEKKYALVKDHNNSIPLISCINSILNYSKVIQSFKLHFGRTIIYLN